MSGALVAITAVENGSYNALDVAGCSPLLNVLIEAANRTGDQQLQQLVISSSFAPKLKVLHCTRAWLKYSGQQSIEGSSGSFLDKIDLGVRTGMRLAFTTGKPYTANVESLRTLVGGAAKTQIFVKTISFRGYTAEGAVWPDGSKEFYIVSRQQDHRESEGSVAFEAFEAQVAAVLRERKCCWDVKPACEGDISPTCTYPPNLQLEQPPLSEHSRKYPMGFSNHWRYWTSGGLEAYRMIERVPYDVPYACTIADPDVPDTPKFIGASASFSALVGRCLVGEEQLGLFWSPAGWSIPYEDRVKARLACANGQPAEFEAALSCGGGVRLCRVSMQGVLVGSRPGGYFASEPRGNEPAWVLLSVYAGIESSTDELAAYQQDLTSRVQLALDWAPRKYAASFGTSPDAIRSC